MISDEGGRGLSHFLFFSDMGGRGGKPISNFWLIRVGGGIWTPPPFLADILCEQPLSAQKLLKRAKRYNNVKDIHMSYIWRHRLQCHNV